MAAVPRTIFKTILAAALLFGAWRLAFGGKFEAPIGNGPPLFALLLLGALLGFLSGFMVKGGAAPSITWVLFPVVLAGGCLGSLWGSHRAESPALQRPLAVVLVVAAAKFTII